MENRKQPVIKKVLSHYDVSLILLILFLCVFGLIMIYSTSYFNADHYYNDEVKFFENQLMFLGIGFAGMLIVSMIDYHVFFKTLIPVYKKISIRPTFFIWLICLGLQVYVYFKGHGVNGSQRWISIGGSFTLQPSEFTKAMLVMATPILCCVFKKYFKNIAGLFVVGIPLAIPIAFVLMQNLSSAIIMGAVVFGTCFVISRKKWQYFVLLIPVVALGAYLLFNGTGYRAARIDTWLNPENDPGSQVMQGFYAIASGGLFGKGLGNGVLKKGYIQEVHTDMIFTVICEELGLLGAVAVIIVFLLLLFRIMKIAMNATDMLGSLIATGVFIQIAVQFILNIAVVTGTIPPTGVVLPFISYGGSSLIALMLEMGLVLSVSKYTVEDISED